MTLQTKISIRFLMNHFFFPVWNRMSAVKEVAAIHECLYAEQCRLSRLFSSLESHRKNFVSNDWCTYCTKNHLHKEKKIMIQHIAPSMNIYVRCPFVEHGMSWERKKKWLLFTSTHSVQHDITTLKNKTIVMQTPRQHYLEVCTSATPCTGLGATAEELTSVKNCTMCMR